MASTDDGVTAFVEKVLYDDKTYYKMLYHTAMKPLLDLKNEHVTREQLAKNTKACRYWQLFCAILFSVYKRNKTTFHTLIHRNKKGVNATRMRVQLSERLMGMIHEALKRIYTNKHSRLYKLVFNNDLQPCREEENGGLCPTLVESVDDLLSVGPHYFGVCLDNETVSHYFTIYKTGKDEYHLSSSYGSDFIHSPATTKEMTLYEFSTFVDAIQQADQDAITSFYHKFFFSHLQPIYSAHINTDFYEPYVEKGYFRSTRLQTGPELELNQALFRKVNNRSAAPIIGIYEFVNYQNELDDLVQQLMSGGGSRMKKTKRRVRHVKWGKNTYRKIPSRK
jgi:hypothetical protein